jgi:hypothetical protein
MNFDQLYAQLVQDFHLQDLPEEDRDEMLVEVAKTIQKQFLLDVYDKIGETQFDALQASANMGEEFYATTLKHVVPDYEQLFQEARKKVVEAFHNG